MQGQGFASGPGHHFAGFQGLQAPRRGALHGEGQVSVGAAQGVAGAEVSLQAGAQLRSEVLFGLPARPQFELQRVGQSELSTKSLNRAGDHATELAAALVDMDRRVGQFGLPWGQLALAGEGVAA